MKNLFIYILAAAAMYSCGNSNGFNVTGGVTPDLGDSVYILKASSDREILASAAVDENGKFTLAGEVAEPVAAILVNGDKQPVAMFFLENAKITINPSEENDSEYIVSGTSANDNFRLLNESLSAIQQEFFALGDDATPEQEQALQAKYDKLLGDAITNNKDNLLGVYIFGQTFGELEPAEAQARIAEFSTPMQSTEMMNSIKESVDTKVNTSIGKPYINITLPDANGQEVALSSLIGQGKWVLVDFWATWCGPCMMEIPHLVEAYKAFADKGFAIYGVSLDDDRDAWANDLVANEMTWTNVIDIKQEGKDQAAKTYGIRSIPANFLISPEGIIVAKDLRGEEVMVKLQELIK